MLNSGRMRPRLVVSDATRAIDYYTTILGAEETARRTAADGRVVGAELAFGATAMTLTEGDDGASPVMLELEVAAIGEMAERMVAAGGTVVRPAGDGHGADVEDPFGHVWALSEATLDEVDLWALTDLQTPWCVHVVASLRIADHIAAGVEDIDGLADAADCDAGALHAVLGHLSGRGVFTETGPGRFGLNDAARRLLGPSGFLDLGGIGGRMAYAWGTLPTYVRTGRSGYHEVFGLPFWEDLAAHPEVAASFDALMGPAGHGTPDAGFDITGGWESVRTVVDVGGGTGAMLAEILRTRPGVRGTLVDLPGTVARAAPTFEAAGVSDRVTTVGQSFFDPLPAGADLYLLKKVLNDWPDRETTAILRRCAEAARPDGRVVVLGGVSPDGEPPRLSIEMVLVAARTNTVSEFGELAGRADLTVVSAGRQPNGHFVVECRPS